MRSWVLSTTFIFLTLSFSLPAQAATYTIYPDGSGDFSTIQQALYNLNDSDVILLGDGIFMGPGNRDLDTNETILTIESESGDPTLCIIDCQGSSYEPHFGFEYSALNSESILRGISIINGYAAEYGGALRLFDASITIENCIFNNNSALNFGGAVYATEWSSPTFFNCEFGFNTAIEYGQGGAVFTNMGSSASFDECMFKGNHANYGGALFAENSGSVLFNHCIFNENSATYGGVVYATGDSEAKLYNSTLFRNEAAQGSSVYVVQGGVCRLNSTIIAFGINGPSCSGSNGGSFIVGCTDIFANEGGDWVGPIAGLGSLNNNANVDPQFCDPMGSPANFQLVQASPVGESHPCGILGAKPADFNWDAPVYTIFANGSGMFTTIQAAVDAVPYHAAISLEDGTYTGDGNRDIELRGKSIRVTGRSADPTTVIIDVEASGVDNHRAFLIHEGEPATTTLEFLTMRNGFFYVDLDLPIEGFGGAVRLSDGANLIVQSCNFDHNTVSDPMPYGYPDAGQGAAIYNGGNGLLRMENCNFNENFGASTLYAVAGNLEILNSTFSNDRGAVDCYQTSAVEITGCLFENFTKSGISIFEVTEPILIQGCGFRSNSRTFSMALLSDCQSVSLDQCLFEELGNGEQILMSMLFIGESQATIQRVVFDGNEVDGSKAVYCRDSISLFVDCEVKAATGTQGGSAVFVDEGTAEFQDCLFSGNSFEDGGAVGTTGAEVSFDQCEFSDNTSFLEGGGAKFISTNVTLNETSFVNNNATLGGGFYAESCTLTVDNCTFTDNAAGDDGGAVLLFLGQADLSNCLFAGNTTDGAGGAIHTWNATTALTECAINGNSAVGGAGGSYHHGNTTAYFGGRLSGNSSTSSGGGIGISGSDLHLDGVDISGNSAERAGGLIVFASDLTMNNCILTNNSAPNASGLYFYMGGIAEISNSLIANNLGSGILTHYDTEMTISNSTITGNGTTNQPYQIGGSNNIEMTVVESIIAFSPDGAAALLGDETSSVEVIASNVFGNADGDWTGPLAGQESYNCNFSDDPYFCDAGEGDYHLAEFSLCLAENNVCALDIGAFGAGCAGVSNAPENEFPEYFTLLGNSPNPFNPQTDISFELPNESSVTLDVFDVTGRLICRLVDGDSFGAGSHQIAWDGNDTRGQAQSSGVYLYRVQATGQSLIGKMTMVR